jgi:phosphatidate cytidylyltransferase
MTFNIYLIILSFFALGGVGFWRINRRRNPEQASKNWLKYFTYFIIIHVVFMSMVVNPLLFHFLALLIMVAGLLEITGLFFRSGNRKPGVFAVSLLIYLVFATGFFQFSLLPTGVLLFTFLITALFDAFCQISGQLFGRRKLFPAISPAKTVEGLIGGAVLAMLTSLLLKGLLRDKWQQALLFSAGIIVFAFIGDLLTSWYKRQYKVKDFGKILPGHGGVLDRFDSLLGGGAFIGLLSVL